MNYLQDQIKAFNDKYFPGWRQRPFLYWSNALAGEVGELCNTVKKSQGGGTKPETRAPHEIMEAMEDELADVAIYANLFALRIGADLDELMIRKMQKIVDRMEERYYTGPELRYATPGQAVRATKLHGHSGKLR